MPDLADTLYGGGAPVPSNPGAPNDLGVSQDHAAILYGGDGKAGARPAWDEAADTEAMMRLSRRAEDNPDAVDPASKLYGDKSGEFDGTEFSSAMDSLAIDALKDGNTDRSDALEYARQGLVSDFKAAGTDSGDVGEAMGIVNAYAYSMPDEATRAATEASTMESLSAELGNQVDTHIRAARRFINDLDRVSPGLKDSLERSGAGNDPKLVRLVIKEAKRRGYV
jgi:hypothetical protein